MFWAVVLIFYSQKIFVFLRYVHFPGNTYLCSKSYVEEKSSRLSFGMGWEINCHAVLIGNIFYILLLSFDT